MPGAADDGGTPAPCAGSSRKPTVKDFLFGKLIGEGSFSSVYLVKDLKSGEEYAIKVCDKAHIVKEKKKNAIMREKYILSELLRKPSPLVVTLKCSFQDEDRLYFVITYAKNGDLLKYIHKVGNFNMQCTKFYSGELISALKYLHRAGVVHRDLKPENILMTANMHIMLTDFGSAQILPPNAARNDSTNDDEFRVRPMQNKDQDTSSSEHRVYPSEEGENSSVTRRKKRNSFVGTAQYVSPEILTDGPLSPAMDVWALGCIMYQMVSGLPPFRSVSRSRGSDYQIFQGILKLDYSFPEDFDTEAKRIVESILKIEPKERATLSDLEKDSFYRALDIDKLHEQQPPSIVPFLPGTEETRWDEVPLPGLDESNMSRLLGLKLNEEAFNASQNLSRTNGPASDQFKGAGSPSTSRPSVGRLFMNLTDEEQREMLDEQRCKSEWHRFCEGNLILKKGMVDKRKGLFPRRRMLLLTTGPHLYYVDPEKMVRKGEIPWSPALKPEPKNFKTFFVQTPNRTYNLEDPEGYALRWCNAIEEVYEHYYGPRKSD